MQDKEHESPANRFGRTCEILGLTIVAIGVYVRATILFIAKTEKLAEIAGDYIVWFLGPLVPVMVAGVGIIWIIGRKRWLPKSPQVNMLKKIVSVLVFSLSASVLSWWVLVNLLSRFMW